MELFQNNKFLKIFIAVLIVFFCLIIIYLYLQNQKLKSQIMQQIVPTVQVPSPTSIVSSISIPSDETANWKTYTVKEKLYFKYPSNYFLKEQAKNSILISPNDNLSQNSNIITIDARDLGMYTSFEEAVISAKQGVTSLEEKKIENGIMITGTVWNGDKTLYQKIRIAILKTKKGDPIQVIYTGDNEGAKVFDQILSTFKFITVKDEKESSCIKEGADWLTQFNECESPTLTESYCQKLGGKFSGCESPCRHNPKSDICQTLCMAVCKFN